MIRCLKTFLDFSTRDRWSFLQEPKVGKYIQGFRIQIFNPQLNSQWYTLFYIQNNSMNVADKAFLFLLYGQLLKCQLNGQKLQMFSWCWWGSLLLCLCTCHTPRGLMRRGTQNGRPFRVHDNFVKIEFAVINTISQSTSVLLFEQNCKHQYLQSICFIHTNCLEMRNGNNHHKP